jgi:hypothetical protein
MKKQLLSLCLLFLTASLFGTWSDTDKTDSTRNHASIRYIAGASSLPVINGNAGDAIWKVLPSINICRPFSGESPTLYSAYWKAFWTDTALFVLVNVEDNSFWPSWKSGQSDWASDKIELYLDVNGKTPDGYGASTAGAKGLYQITNNYDTVQAMGIEHPGSFDSTFQANTWSYGDHPIMTVEWLISFKALKDSNGTPFDPWETMQIGFDVCISDLDSGQAIRQRQIWSNTGQSEENWNNMDSAGIITFSGECMCCAYKSTECNAVQQFSSLVPAITPTFASTTINVPAEISRIEIVDVMGRTVLQAYNYNNLVDISTLTKGIYYVRLFNSNGLLGTQGIFKY